MGSPPATSAPGLGSPSAAPVSGLGSPPATSAPGPRAPLRGLVRSSVCLPVRLPRGYEVDALPAVVRRSAMSCDRAALPGNGASSWGVGADPESLFSGGGLFPAGAPAVPAGGLGAGTPTVSTPSRAARHRCPARHGVANGAGVRRASALALARCSRTSTRCSADSHLTLPALRRVPRPERPLASGH
jgi:hypothetical protein